MLLKRVYNRPAKRADDLDGESRAFLSGDNLQHRVQTLAGSRVDEDLALTLSSVMCATRIVAETVSTFPLHLYRRIDDDGREKASDNRLFDMLDVMPNPDMGAAAFREGRTAHQCNFGSGLAEIERVDSRDDMSEPLAMWPIHPSRVRPTWVQDGVDRNAYPYMVRNNDLTYVPMKASELLHVPGVVPEDGRWGKGMVAYARETIGGAFSVERHGYAYFAGGAQPKGVVKLPAMLLKDKEQRAQYRKEWKEFHAGPDSNEVMLMPPEGSYDPIPISNEDSQFNETVKLAVAKVAQFYRLPVYMFGIFEKASARASIEAQGIEFVMYSIMPWLRKWEEQLNIKLLTPAQRKEYFIEHNVTALLRGDVGSRFNAYKTAIGGGWMTINQVCRLENLPTIGPAGDVNYVMLNMTTAQAMYDNPPQPADPSGGKPAAEPAALEEPPIDGPKGKDPKALADWIRTAAEQFQASAAGKQTQRIRSAVIHSPPTPDAFRASAKSVLSDVLTRFGVREAERAKAAAKGDLEEWAAKFYPDHQEQLAGALKPAAEVITALGIAFDRDGFAMRACRDARLAMVHAYNSDTPETFAKRLAEWPAAFAAAGVAQVLGDA